MQETRERKRKRVIRSCRECLRRKQKCDRAQPCSNCVMRKVEESCVYGEQESTQDENLLGESTDRPYSPEDLLVEESQCDDVDMSVFGYSKTSDYSTLAGLKKLQIQHKTLDLASEKDGSNRRSGQRASFAARYNNLVKRLPPDIYRECLIQIFFDDVNWVYSMLDLSMFRSQLQDWQQSCEKKTAGNDPSKLTPDRLYFPALLFQVFALSLLALPPAIDIDLEPLKQGKSVNTLAAEYSHFGCELVSLLSCEDPCLVSIQHDMLRASWLKTSGFVPKSWHILSQAIRQAQEIGLHEEQAPKFSEGEALQESLRRVWHCEYRKRLWINLYMWDSNMAMMLGRPMTIDSNPSFIPPLNCHIPEDFWNKPPVPIRENEKPCAFYDKILQYQLSLKIPQMLNLRAHRPFPKDPTIIDSLHREIISMLDSFPAHLRQENPDTTWDAECPFIPLQRELLFCYHLSYLLALHRAHVSTIPNSRLEAIKAATDILNSQNRLFGKLKPQHYKFHSITFYTFDAAVNLATILLSTPPSDQSDIQNALKCLGQAIRRLEIISLQSSLSKSALSVIRVLHQQLKQESSNPSIPIVEQSGEYENFYANFLEEQSRKDSTNDSAFSIEPVLESFTSFDPGSMENMFDLRSDSLMTQTDALASLDSDNIDTFDENMWTVDGRLIGDF